jgi:hypothetical protein
MSKINAFVPDQIVVSPSAFYAFAMPVVGGYNQGLKGDGYNAGWPFFGEHTYSGTGIYKGYFGSPPPITRY